MYGCVRSELRNGHTIIVSSLPPCLISMDLLPKRVNGARDSDLKHMRDEGMKPPMNKKKV